MNGETLHSYYGYSNVDERSPAPKILDHTIVGFGVKIIGGVTIGYRSYLAAGAVVTRDVPDESIVTGVNGITRPNEWTGKLSQKGPWSRK